MNRRLAIAVAGIVVLSLSLVCGTGEAETASTKDAGKTSDELIVLWTSGDREVALKMVFMYVYNAKRFKWWEDITLIVWGPSSKLTAEDKEIRSEIKKTLGEGVVVKACKACADLYGISPKLADLGIEVKYIGQELTQYIKSGTHLITF